MKSTKEVNVDDEGVAYDLFYTHISTEAWEEWQDRSGVYPKYESTLCGMSWVLGDEGTGSDSPPFAYAMFKQDDLDITDFYRRGVICLKCMGVYNAQKRDRPGTSG